MTLPLVTGLSGAPIEEQGIPLSRLIEWWYQHPDVHINPVCPICGRVLLQATAFINKGSCDEHKQA